MCSLIRILILGVTTAAVATPVAGVTLQWEQSAASGNWHDASNWFQLSSGVKVGGSVPVYGDTVYLGGYSGQSGEYNIRLTADAGIKDISGDGFNHDDLHYRIDGGGHTLWLTSVSHIGTNLTLTNGTFDNQNGGWNVGTYTATPTTVTVGAGALLRTAGSRLDEFMYGNLSILPAARVVVETGGQVMFSRGRSTWISDGAELDIRAGGVMGGTRYLHALAGSTLRLTLDNTSYTGETAAITVDADIVELGNLAIELVDGYVHHYGQVFNLIEYKNFDDGSSVGTAHGLFSTFTGVAEGTVINVGGNAFTVNYGDGVSDMITLTAVPEPGTFALLGLVGLGVLRRRPAW